MEFNVVADAVGVEAEKAVKYILSRNWPTEKKKQYLERLFRLTGDEFYNRLFDMSSAIFDSAALKDLGFTNPDDQIERLSTTLIRNYNLSRKTDDVTTEFYYAVMSDAQTVAFRNAVSLDKHPVLIRSAHSTACRWCQNLAGRYVDPEYEAFRHHEGCKCDFRLSGYGTRDGTYSGHVPNRYENPYAWLKENRMKGVQ